MSRIQTEKFQIHNYDSFIKAIIRHITTEFSSTNSELILKYDKVMVRESLAKDTRYLLYGDLLTTSENKKNRINKILKEK